jgi:hypothetical protein
VADPPPPIALRTYTAIRMGVVAVIVALAFAVWREIANSPGHCVQRSLSAYYYTPVRPVFVGALMVIGFAMIVMWGMTPFEDAALNLAGLLLTVVSIVPTLDANYCRVPTTIATPIKDPEAKKIADDALITANAATVERSFTALLFVLALSLAFFAVAGLWLYFSSTEERRPIGSAFIAYLVTWGVALIAGVIYYLLYRHEHDLDSAFNHKVHSYSANIAVGFVIFAVLCAAIQKGRSDDENKTRWVWLYAILAGTMVLVAAFFKGGDHFKLFHGWFGQHSTFLVEATLIGLIGVFWTLQTIERRKKGAPTYRGFLAAGTSDA